MRRIRSRAMMCATIAAALAGAVVATPSVGAAGQQNQQNLPVFRADASLVMVQVSVLDAGGLPVDDLTASDLRLFEDGVERDIELLLRPDETPIDVGLLMDLSGSVRADARALRRDALAFLDALGPDDCVHFLPFATEVGAGTWGRPDDARLRDAIQGSRVEGYTPLYDALLAGIERVGNAPAGCSASAGDAASTAAEAESATVAERRKAVVVLTDGGDTSSQAAFSAAVNAASLAEVPIFPVAIGYALTEGQSANLGTDAQRGGGLEVDASVRSKAGDGLVQENEAGWEFDHATRAIGQSVQERRDARLRSYGNGLADSLRELAAISGGVYVEGGAANESLATAYTEILTWLRASYSVGFRPSPLPGDRSTDRGRAAWRGLEVRADDPAYRVYARPGYYQRDIDPAAAAAAVQAGVDMLRDELTREAVAAFGQALAADPFSWEAHYYRGRAFGVQGMFAAAREDFLAAARLGPGVGTVHEFAAIASIDAGDYATAWDHLIRAQQAGQDVSQRVETLRAIAPPPADLEERLAVPRIYVGHSIVPDVEAQTLIEALARAARRAISEAPQFGLVADASLADYGLSLQIDDIDTGGPGRAGGRLLIRNAAGDVVEERDFMVDEVFTEAATRATLAELLESVAPGLEGR